MSLKKWIIKRIEDYQKDKSLHTTKKCRFTPTCSEYGKQCFMKFNFFKASFLTIKRIIKCHPFAKMKYDPVPEERKYQHKWKTLEESMNDYYYKNLYK